MSDPKVTRWKVSVSRQFWETLQSEKSTDEDILLAAEEACDTEEEALYCEALESQIPIDRQKGRHELVRRKSMVLEVFRERMAPRLPEALLRQVQPLRAKERALLVSALKIHAPQYMAEHRHRLRDLNQFATLDGQFGAFARWLLAAFRALYTELQSTKGPLRRDSRRRGDSI